MRPGGLEKVRPAMESSIVKTLMDQPMMAGLPLSLSEKEKLCHRLVSMSLDLLLQDAKEILADPNDRLQALEQRRREVTRYMTKWQLLLYEIRYHPIKSAFLASTGLFLAFSFYKEIRTTAIVKRALRTVFLFYATVHTTLSKLLPTIPKRRIVRRPRSPRRRI